VPPATAARYAAPSAAGTIAANAPLSSGTTFAPVFCQVVPSSVRSIDTPAVPTGTRPVSRRPCPASTAPVGASRMAGATVIVPAMNAWIVQRKA